MCVDRSGIRPTSSSTSPARLPTVDGSESVAS